MEITSLGHASFKINGKTVAVVTDPFDAQMLGFSYPKTEADIITISHDHKDHNAVGQVAGNPFVIDGPGEYEIKEVTILGVASSHDILGGGERGKNIIYVIEMEGIRLCHLGDQGQKLNEAQLEELNGVDILFVPVGGVYTIDPRQAIEVISQIEPKIIIPMHYKVAKMGASFEKLSTVEDFLKEVGEEIAAVPKLVITRDKLPEERQIVVLERRG